jgi:hypothetical protein
MLHKPERKIRPCLLINNELLAEGAGVGLKSFAGNKQVLEFKARWKRR